MLSFDTEDGVQRCVVVLFPKEDLRKKTNRLEAGQELLGSRGDTASIRNPGGTFILSYFAVELHFAFDGPICFYIFFLRGFV